MAKAPEPDAPANEGAPDTTANPRKYPNTGKRKAADPDASIIGALGVRRRAGRPRKEAHANLLAKTAIDFDEPAGPFSIFLLEFRSRYVKVSDDNVLLAYKAWQSMSREQKEKYCRSYYKVLPSELDMKFKTRYLENTEPIMGVSSIPYFAWLIRTLQDAMDERMLGISSELLATRLGDEWNRLDPATRRHWNSAKLLEVRGAKTRKGAGMPNYNKYFGL